MKYRLPLGKSSAKAFSGAPGLVNDGEIVLDHTTLTKEQFFRKRHHCDGSWDAGVVPTDYAAEYQSDVGGALRLG